MSFMSAKECPMSFISHREGLASLVPVSSVSYSILPKKGSVSFASCSVLPKGGSVLFVSCSVLPKGGSVLLMLPKEDNAS